MGVARLRQNQLSLTLWYQSGTSTRSNTCHTNMEDLVGLCGGQPARVTVWGKRTFRYREMSYSEERASRFGIQRNGQPFAREAPRGQASEEEYESLGRQHMGVVYHRGRSQIVSTSESHGGDLIIQRYDQSGWRVGLLQCSHLLKGARQVRGQGQKGGGLRGAPQCRRGGSTDREGRNADARQRIVGPWVWQYHGMQRRNYRGVINPLLSLRESIGHKRGRGGGEYKGKLQVPRQGGRAEAKKLHKTSVDGLLLKIAESEGLRVDVRVLDQGTK
ncbi:hypothetical protein GW17_00009410 [Ensete ventricosum]|nr:hypothetical protein GW17_00009410 [Ensete ventricosum]